MSITTLQLRQDIELMHGMDDMPLIFDPLTGSYHRISRSAEALLAYFDGSRSTDDLVTLLSRGDASRADQVRQQVSAFVTVLDSSGLLVGSELPDSSRRDRRLQTSRLMPRIVVSRSLPRRLEPVARLVRPLPLAALGTIIGLAALTGFGFGVWMLARHGGTASPFAARDGLVSAAPVVAAALILQLLMILIHECAHAVVAQVLRVPVRGLGFALLLYFLPVAYVDRTDAYRLRSRGDRLAIALAGIVSDGLLCGATGVVADTTTGLVQQVCVTLLGFQLLSLLFNINPLLPTDGYTAIEIALRLVDLRGRSFALLRHAVLRRPLPSHLQRVTGGARAGYLAYGVFAVAYIVLALTMFLLGMYHSFTTVAEAVGAR